MNPLLDSLIAQWRRCGGTRGECRTRHCKRCERGMAVGVREAAHR